MDDELTPEQRFGAEDAETMVPRALMQGRHPADVVAELVRLDWTPEAARALVERVVDDLRRFYDSPESRARLVREARVQVVSGLLFAVPGAVVTGFMLAGAMTGMLPMVILAYGLLFGGLAQAARGWTRWRLYRKPTLPFPLDPRAADDAHPEDGA